jgi:hypothetical protein
MVQRPAGELLEELGDLLVLCSGCSDVSVEAKRGLDTARDAGASSSWRESIDRRIKSTRSVLNGIIEPEQLAEPLMLRNSGQPLIQEELQAVVVDADEEPTSPKVQPPMPHYLHQPDEFAFVGRQFDVAGSERAVEGG